jgi:glutamate racemase
LAGAGPVRITYFNAWPEQDSGYNDMPDIRARARAFDRALAGMAALEPDCIVIACNTLSVVYEHTAFRRASTIPVVGIVGVGIERFASALAAAPGAGMVLFGTRTTIESDTHRTRLIERGIAPERIAAVSCHGLARAIEMDPDGNAITSLVEACTAVASREVPGGTPLYLGICCTHYTYISGQMQEALQRQCGRAVETLDPNDSLVADVLARVRGAIAQRCADAANVTGRGSQRDPDVTVTVLSKVEMDEARRRSIARRVRDVSPAAAAALLSYTRVPDLF